MTIQPTVQQRDVGYGCFLLVGLASVSVTLADMADDFILLMLWLAVPAVLAVPAGIFASILYWRDGVLPVLSILTVAFVVELLTEAGSVEFYNASMSLYGVLVLMIVASWFLFRRRRLIASQAVEPPAA